MIKNDTGPVFRAVSSTPTMRVVLRLPSSRSFESAQPDSAVAGAQAEGGNDAGAAHPGQTAPQAASAPSNAEYSSDESPYRPIFRKYCRRHFHSPPSTDYSPSAAPQPESEPEQCSAALNSAPQGASAMRWRFSPSRSPQVAPYATPQTAYESSAAAPYLPSPQLLSNFQRVQIVQYAPKTAQAFISPTQFKEQYRKIDELLRRVEMIDGRLYASGGGGGGATASTKTRLQAAPASPVEGEQGARSAEQDTRDPMQLYSKISAEMCSQEASRNAIAEYQRLQLAQNALLSQQINALALELRRRPEGELWADSAPAPPSGSTEKAIGGGKQSSDAYQFEEYHQDRSLGKTQPLSSKATNTAAQLNEEQTKYQPRTLQRHAPRGRPSRIPAKAALSQIPRFAAPNPLPGECIPSTTRSSESLRYEPFQRYKLRDPYAARPEKLQRTPKTPTLACESHDYIGDALSNFEQKIGAPGLPSQSAVYDEEIAQLKRKGAEFGELIRRLQ